MSVPTALTLSEHAAALYKACESGVPIAPRSELEPELDTDCAYAIQRELIACHRAAGRSPVGRKIGLTSEAIQRQLGVGEPDYGVVLDSHTWSSGATLRRTKQRMIAPRLEAELAFELDRPLAGHGLEIDDVLDATRSIVPVWELIDSRIEDWRITLQDTIADNASCLGVVVGERREPFEQLDAVALKLERDGQVLASGSGSAVLGHPARAVAWLAGALARHDEWLKEGELILSGSFTAAVPAELGRYRASFSHGLGAVEVTIDE